MSGSRPAGRRRAATRIAFVLVAVTCGLVAAGIALDRIWPPDLTRLTPSAVVEDRHGTMLRAFETRDQQWRLAADLARVSPNYIQLLIATEDKRFWQHPGVDPLALLRALGQLVTHGHVVSGGSTLTMQVVRLLEPRPRTLRSKLVEAFRAMQLERRLTKREILAAYLTLTPMGGNLEGVRAGALAWLGKEPQVLSDAEAALLVALPQAPRILRPDVYPARAERARAKVLARAQAAGLLESAAIHDALAAPLPVRRRPLPRLAPHLAERLVAGTASTTSPIRTAIDAPTQGSTEGVLRQVLAELPRPLNVAALVADWHTGEILARAGSGDDLDASRSGAIDMTRALRSPGSTLKPFIYGMAFEGLLAHPDSLVRDEPTRFDDYAPHNFDGGFHGDVTIRHALQASLNLPAVVALQKVGPVAFAARFRDAGLPLALADDDAAPSLPMALGGTGVTLESLVTAYAALAHGGSITPLLERTDAIPDRGTGSRLLGVAAADAVVDILAGMPPPKGLGPRAGRIAYKTGTSYRFRDGWAIGFDDARVIGVWIGRADGGTCVGCVGQAAAGLLFRLFDQLAPAPLSPRTLAPVFAAPPPPSLKRLTVTERTRLASDPHIAFPLANARVLVDETTPDIKLAVDGGQRPYRWVVDGHAIQSAAYARQAAWHPTQEGFTTVTVTDAAGRSDAVRVRLVRRQE